MVCLWFRRKLALLLGCVLSVLLFVVVWAQTGSERPNELRLSSGASGKLYWPKGSQDHDGERGLIIALHGLKQTPDQALQAWAPVAEALDLVVLSPSGNVYEHGYTREPIDDRERIRELRDQMVAKYGIDPDRIYLAGFSRGGNYAIELGLKYPEIFPRVMCLFGFYNSLNDPLLQSGLAENRYSRSHFYLVTGYGDMTESSLTEFYRRLGQNGIATKLYVFPDLFHAYPKDFPAFFKKVLLTWQK